MISLAKPNISTEEINAVVSVLKSGQLAQGKIVEQFEKEFAEFIETKYAVAVSNGTTALHLALLACGIKQGDEVITSPFSFIATANTITYVGAKPVFADIDPTTYTIDPEEIKKKITKRTKAILPVHLYGLPANMKAIKKIAKEYNLLVIEDAAQAHGAAINNKKVGALGDIGCFSFYPTKNMTTGEGGMITTNKKRLAEKIKLLRAHHMPKRYYHSDLGYNFRMTNIAAAIGKEQLKKLKTFNEKRIELAKLYKDSLTEVKGLIVPFIPKDYTHVFHQFTVRITPKYHKTREALIKELQKNGIASEIYYPLPIHQQKLYRKLGYRVSVKHSEHAAKEVLSLPIHPGLTKKDIVKISEILRR